MTAQNKLSRAALRITLRRFLSVIFTAFRCYCRVLCVDARSLRCHAAFILASTPGPAHQPCAPRGPFEHGADSAAVESMTYTTINMHTVVHPTTNFDSTIFDISVYFCLCFGALMLSLEHNGGFLLDAILLTRCYYIGLPSCIS